MDVSAHENFNLMPEFHEVGKSAADETVMWNRIKIERGRVTVDTLPTWCVESKLRDP
jgi:hypothetical protein